ncbi:hypothetical protein BKA82DRAFT_4016360 [Pisolithus tinctorius]|nr:hypothetical protein BKA82DRAFT_4016360 [Pisolithus tinctorius]
MYAAKFAVFSIIAAITVLASAAPAPFIPVWTHVLADGELQAHRPLPVAEAVAGLTPKADLEDVEKPFVYADTHNWVGTHYERNVWLSKIRQLTGWSQRVFLHRIHMIEFKDASLGKRARIEDNNLNCVQ